MAILVSNIVPRINSTIDSEGSQRFLFDEDIKPALNYAVEYSISVFNSIFSKDKLSEEILKELIRVRCWKTNNKSRFTIDDTVTGDVLWSILSIMVRCEIEGAAPAGIFIESVYVPQVIFKKSKYYAKRLTREQWAEKETNRFIAGSPLETCPDLIKYAWTNFSDYTGTAATYTNSKNEIEISPDVSNTLIACSYLRKPATINVMTDIIELPEIMTNFVINKAVQYLSYKENDNTNLYGITSKDTDLLIKLF